jgi:uncharacterized membrane protein
MKKIEEAEKTISQFLRAGVVVSGTLIFIGWISELNWHGNIFFTFEIYDQISLIDLLRLHLYREHWFPIISYVGLAALISLPLIRVLLTSVLFFRSKEYKLGFIALIVFLGLSFSIGLGMEL